MRYFRRFICTILIFCTLICLASCSSGKSNIEDVFSQLVINESDAESETEDAAFAEHIYVIISKECSGELSLKARELATLIGEKTGILTSLKYDNELIVAPKNSCEILIGNTNRLVSDNAMDILKKDEYLCHWDDGALVICGRSDASTIVAIDRFIEEILPGATKYSLMHDAAHFEFMVKYDVERVTLNGYDLYDYVITYPDKNEFSEKDVAVMLRDIINSKCGYFLEVISDAEIDMNDSRIISLSLGDEENALMTEERKISLVGVDLYSLSLVATKFIKDFEDNVKDGNVDLRYDLKIYVPSIDTSFESFIYFMKKNADAPFKPISDLIDMISADDFGLCFIGNPNDNMERDFELNLNDTIKTQNIILGERKIMLAYNEQNLKSFDVTVSNDASYVFVNVETLFGETLSYIYIIKGKIPTVGKNTIIFVEGNSELEADNIYCISNGEFEILDANTSYNLSFEENVGLINIGSVIDDNDNYFCCTLETKLFCSKMFLDYSLK